jgi:hypothetical protein
VEGSNGRQRSVDALRKGSVVDALGQGTKEALNQLGIELNYTEKQKGVLRLAAVI